MGLHSSLSGPYKDCSDTPVITEWAFSLADCEFSLCSSKHRSLKLKRLPELDVFGCVSRLRFSFLPNNIMMFCMKTPLMSVAAKNVQDLELVLPESRAEHTPSPS